MGQGNDDGRLVRGFTLRWLLLLVGLPASYAVLPLLVKMLRNTTGRD